MPGISLRQLWGALGQLLPKWLSTEAAARGFEWGVCVTYVCAFSSFYTQVGGMLGPDGILPVGATLPHYMIPLPLRWMRRPDIGADVLCLVGMALGMGGVVARRARNMGSFTAMWWLYSSLQALMGHDPPLLFEAGLVAIIVSRVSAVAPAVATSSQSGTAAATSAAAASAAFEAINASTARCGLGAARWLSSFRGTMS